VCLLVLVVSGTLLVQPDGTLWAVGDGCELADLDSQIGRRPCVRLGPAPSSWLACLRLNPNGRAAFRQDNVLCADAVGVWCGRPTAHGRLSVCFLALDHGEGALSVCLSASWHWTIVKELRLSVCLLPGTGLDLGAFFVCLPASWRQASSSPRVALPAAQISLVVWLFRYPPKTALGVGLSMAQIGEFAFVLLSVASQHGLIPYQMYMMLMGPSVRLPHCPLSFYLSVASQHGLIPS
jgi:hypothetical protein